MSETGNGGGGGARERGVMAGEEGVGGGCLGFGPPESDCGEELLRVAPSIPSARSLASQVAEAKREAGRRCAAAADLRREVDSLHGQLAKLQALLLLLSPPPPPPHAKAVLCFDQLHTVSAGATQGGRDQGDAPNG